MRAKSAEVAAISRPRAKSTDLFMHSQSIFYYKIKTIDLSIRNGLTNLPIYNTLYRKFDVLHAVFFGSKMILRKHDDGCFSGITRSSDISRCGLHRLVFCKGVYSVSFVDSLLVALFLMAIVFTALFALYLFVKLFSLIVEIAEHAAKHKKAAH